MRAKPERYGTHLNTATKISQSECGSGDDSDKAQQWWAVWGWSSPALANIAVRTHARKSMADTCANPVQSKCAKGGRRIFIIDFNVNTYIPINAVVPKSWNNQRQHARTPAAIFVFAYANCVRHRAYTHARLNRYIIILPIVGRTSTDILPEFWKCKWFSNRGVQYHTMKSLVKIQQNRPQKDSKFI